MDRNFDDLFERLKKMIYGSLKGRLRVELLLEDLEPFVNNKNNRLVILDAGGGFGQVSLKLAELGHKIIFCDISKKMLEEAEKNFEEAGLSENIEILQIPFQNLPEKYYEYFDLVLSHAVMEWLEEPENSFKTLIKFIKPGGLLSLMFYNLNSLICQNAIKGNFFKIMNEEFSGNPNGLTPVNPLYAEEVALWLKEENFEIISKTGIRVFYDLMFKKMRNERPGADIVEIEKKYCRQEPFASMGRYVHFVGMKK